MPAFGRNRTRGWSILATLLVARSSIGLALLALAVVSPVEGGAQSSVNISLVRDSVLVGDTLSCRFEAIRRARTADDNIRDTLYLRIRQSMTSETAVAAGVPLQVFVGSERLGSMSAGRTDTTFHLDPVSLADRIVAVRRVDGTSYLCRFMPFPYLPSSDGGLAGQTHTDVIASGEVSNALRSGATSSAVATGTLGFFHVSLPQGNGPRSMFPFGRENLKSSRRPWSLRNPLGGYSLSRPLSFYRMDGEELRVVINVASTVDSIVGPVGGKFAQALLVPSSGAGAGNRAVDLEYFPYRAIGSSGNQKIGLMFHFTASDALWSPDPSGEAARLSSRAVLTAYDVRLKAVLVNRPPKEDGNAMSFAVDGGWIRRSVGGDITTGDGKTVLLRSLGDSTKRSFEGYAVATTFRLRQVTAYADLLCLGCRFLFVDGSSTKIPSLQDLQPVIGFRFDAPLFTIRH
jgi:hypothetical protein